MLWRKVRNKDEWQVVEGLEDNFLSMTIIQNEDNLFTLDTTYMYVRGSRVFAATALKTCKEHAEELNNFCQDIVKEYPTGLLSRALSVFNENESVNDVLRMQRSDLPSHLHTWVYENMNYHEFRRFISLAIIYYGMGYSDAV